MYIHHEFLVNEVLDVYKENFKQKEFLQVCPVQTYIWLIFNIKIWRDLLIFGI